MLPIRQAALAASLLVALAGGSGPVAAQTTPQPVDTAADPVIAIVDGSAIRRSDMVAVQRSLPAQFQQMPLEMIYPMLLERMIDAKLLAGAGRKDKLLDEPEAKARLAQFEERLLQEIYLTRRITAGVTEAAIKARYEKFAKENPPKEEVHARHILVATEAEANAIIAELNKGADFAKLAGEKTIDPSGKTTGGDLGFFGKDEMVPEFSAAAFALKPGEITEKPVKTQFGWHVIKLDEKRSVAPSLEEAREQIVNDLQQDIVTEEVAKLRKDAKVERFNADGSAKKN